MKTQTVRLIDVFFLGPFMIWAGMQLKNDLAQIAMITSGLATMYYNGNNYLIVERDEKLRLSNV